MVCIRILWFLSIPHFRSLLQIKEGDEETGGGKKLSEDERNKIGAKILKAEMKGDKVSFSDKNLLDAEYVLCQ